MKTHGYSINILQKEEHTKKILIFYSFPGVLHHPVPKTKYTS